MDEVWERAVETALEGQTDCSSARALTLDGAAKCIQGRLPPPGLLERFGALEHLSIANVGASSLEAFPRLPNLQKLILSDNRIAGGLEFLVEAGLDSLRDLDLSNNRIQYVEDLAPLAQLKLVSLDLYECPVTRVKDYRSRVFGLIRSLKYLDKMDADENERPESDEEDDDEDDEEDDDPGSGEVDVEDRSGKSANGVVSEGIVDADEDEESDADEEETETARATNGSDRASSSHPLTNGFRLAAAAAGSVDVDVDEDEEDVEDEEDDDLGEEIDEEEGDDDDVVEIHEIDDSEEDEDGVEEDEGEDEEDEEEDEEEDAELVSTGQRTSTEGEIDGHEHGEEDENGEIGEEDEQGVEEDGEYEEDDENGEIGEEDEQGVEEDGEYEEDDGEGEDEEEDIGSEYLVQPIGQAEEEAVGSDLDPGNEDDGEEEEVDDEDDPHSAQLQPSQFKRKRADVGGNDDSVEDSRPSKDSKNH